MPEYDPPGENHRLRVYYTMNYVGQGQLDDCDGNGRKECCVGTSWFEPPLTGLDYEWVECGE